MARLSASEIRSAATTLRRVLEQIAAGELVAPSGLSARLEGAAAALEALGTRRTRSRNATGNESRSRGEGA